MVSEINTNNLIFELNKFIEEREWNKFHSPKNLVMALTGEIGELVEHFQWITEQESYLEERSNTKDKVKEEIADIYIYLLLLSQKLNVNLDEEALKK